MIRFVAQNLAAILPDFCWDLTVSFAIPELLFRS